MTIDGGQLLRRLEPPVKAGANDAARASSGGRLDSPSFDRMLALISRSSGVGGRSVLARFAVEPPLEAQQLSRLAGAAEVAEKAEAERALMLIDGRALVMDVPRRELVSEMKEGSRHELLELDAAVYVAPMESRSQDANARSKSAAFPGLHSFLPPAVAAQLASAAGEQALRHGGME